MRWRGSLVLLVVPWLLRPVIIQEPPCDPGLQSRARGPHGYRLRGDRCEGIYVQQVSGTVLALASLTESFEEYGLAAGGPALTVEWTAPNGGNVRLRAQGIKRDLYYRMDTVRPSAPATYRWPSDILAAQRVAKRDVGVLGWTRRTLGDVERDVYLPLRIGQRAAPSRADAYELVLFPTVTLKEVYLTLTQVDGAGRPSRVVREGAPLQYGYYPAERPVRITVANLGGAGIYHVEIGAELASAGSVALEHWIYHANAPGTR